MCRRDFRPKVALLPTFYLKENGGEYQAAVDSTPLIRRFEETFKGRAVVPSDPVIEFIDYLLEDYADEWLTKAMFHYRWHYKPDIERAAAILPRWRGISSPEEDMLKMGKISCRTANIAALCRRFERHNGTGDRGELSTLS